MRFLLGMSSLLNCICRISLFHRKQYFTCESSEHHCVCHLSNGIRKCNADVHKCVSNLLIRQADTQCRCNIHDKMEDVCTCGVSSCMSVRHKCTCYTSYNPLCKSTDFHRCTCNRNYQTCRASRAYCDHICICAKHSGDLCLADKHLCSCRRSLYINNSIQLSDITLCLATDHSCLCNISVFLCRTDDHVCSCRYSDQCKYEGKEDHWCICTLGKIDKCLGLEHTCICVQNTETCISTTHNCVCWNVGDTSKCKAYNGHCCTCNIENKICMSFDNSYMKCLALDGYHKCMCDIDRTMCLAQYETPEVLANLVKPEYLHKCVCHIDKISCRNSLLRHHYCTCYSDIETCDGLVHECKCKKYGSRLCRAFTRHHCMCVHKGDKSIIGECISDQHHCICKISNLSGDNKCLRLSNDHECYCLIDPSMCRSNNHFCVCRLYRDKQCRKKTAEHLCICDIGKDESCLALDTMIEVNGISRRRSNHRTKYEYNSISICTLCNEILGDNFHNTIKSSFCNHIFHINCLQKIYTKDRHFSIKCPSVDCLEHIYTSIF